MRRLLLNHADTLYQSADRVESDAVAPRISQTLSLAVLAKRVRQVGQGDDPVTGATSTRGSPATSTRGSPAEHT